MRIGRNQIAAKLGCGRTTVESLFNHGVLEDVSPFRLISKRHHRRADSKQVSMLSKIWVAGGPMVTERRAGELKSLMHTLAKQAMHQAALKSNGNGHHARVNVVPPAKYQSKPQPKAQALPLALPEPPKLPLQSFDQLRDKLLRGALLSMEDALQKTNANQLRMIELLEQLAKAWR